MPDMSSGSNSSRVRLRSTHLRNHTSVLRPRTERINMTETEDFAIDLDALNIIEELIAQLGT
jgi:hypothetical protein